MPKLANATTSIIIRCCNEEQHIGKLLAGICQQTISDVEIVIVDSGSTDATLAIASRYPVKVVHIRPADFTFGRALNIGCEAASGEILVIASAHVYPVYNDWLEKLTSFFFDPKVALVYGKQRGNEVSKYSELRIFQKWFPDASSGFQSHPFCNNANAAIRRSVWECCRYDENLTGLEDLDWAKRILVEGHRMAYSAEAEIIHVHEENLSRILNRYRREAIAMKTIFPDETFSFLDFITLFVSNSINDLYYAAHDRVLLKKFGEIIAFRLLQFWGTYRGYCQHGPISAHLKDRFYYPNQWNPIPSTTSADEAQRKIDYSSL
ncbi:glycosyltransferase family 2 protein [Trichlorobacter ammonificans]|uniref:Family 2 glycosyl transferase n=1 Tax=Trichlorobacter ammonificans TaxID=2916410 RepID=A0ABM9D6A9_9BACT|nr:glycosyltransferase family A protein [Trichlorobacter ammonificans]CAH2029941.1 Family 2 glycosyl transferase [Trichlorobacter ammonificans]